MKKIVTALFLSGAVLGSAMAADTAKEASKGAEAQQQKHFDLSTLTCGEFLQMSAPEAITTLSWIDGYLTQKADAPVWDVETFVQHRDKLINICVDKDGKDKLVLEEIQNLN